MEVQLTRFEHEDRYRCHVLLQLPSNRDINVTEETHDLYEAIDIAEKRLTRQLTEERQRIITAKRQDKAKLLDRLSAATSAGDVAPSSGGREL